MKFQQLHLVYKQKTNRLLLLKFKKKMIGKIVIQGKTLNDII